MKARQRVLSTCLAGAIAFGLVPWAAAVAPANATPNHSLSLGQTVNLEAEQAQLSGGKILTNGTSYSGTGYVGDFYEGSQASFPIHVSESGEYRAFCNGELVPAYTRMPGVLELPLAPGENDVRVQLV